MKIPLQRIFSRYFTSWWSPTLVTLIALTGFSLGMVASLIRPHWLALSILSETLAIMLGVTLLGILVVAIWSFIKRRWVNGITVLFCCSLWYHSLQQSFSGGSYFSGGSLLARITSPTT